MLDYIEVEYEVYSTPFTIKQQLDKLASYPLLSLDTETQSRYTNEERAEAKQLLKCCAEEMSPEDTILSKLVSNSSGLSHPSITKVTHFIFGLSESKSVIFICYDMKTELLIWNWVSQYKGKLLIHNASFDLKIMHHRISKFPLDFEDTQLAVKTMINHVETWKANSGLKHLMGSYYDPSWTLLDDEGYDNPDYKNKKFLRYMAIDGAATYKLNELIQEQVQELKEHNESKTTT